MRPVVKLLWPVLLLTDRPCWDTCTCTCTCWWWTYEAELYELSISAMWSSKRFLKLLTEGAATTWFGNEFHKLTVLCEKKYFLMLSRHDFLYNFSWCPRRFNSREANWDVHVGSISSLDVRILYTSIKSPHCRLFSNVVIFNNCNLCSYFLSFIPITHFVALRWTFSNVSMSFTKYGDHACMQYSMCGLIYR